MHCCRSDAYEHYTCVWELCRDTDVNVGESSDDNLRRVRVEGYGASEGWMAAFDAQCTERLLKQLRRYALLLARFPGGEQLGDHGSYAEELVQTVVADVIDGGLRWDPRKRDLEPYLVDVVRLRVRRDRRRASRYESVSIDTGYSRDRASLVSLLETRLAESASMQASSTDGRIWDEMSATMGRLRELVSSDALALRFLDAVERKANTRAEIMKQAGLSRSEYHNTRRRLARLLVHPKSHGRFPAREN